MPTADASHAVSILPISGLEESFALERFNFLVVCLSSRVELVRLMASSLRASYHNDSILVIGILGGVAEWSIAPVLKTGEPQGSVGSNPTSSATNPRRGF